MSQDPLTAFVARSLRADVGDVRSELVAKNALMEVERAAVVDAAKEYPRT